MFELEKGWSQTTEKTESKRTRILAKENSVVIHLGHPIKQNGKKISEIFSNTSCQMVEPGLPRFSS